MFCYVGAVPSSRRKRKGFSSAACSGKGRCPRKSITRTVRITVRSIPYTSSRSLPHWLEKSKEFRLFTMSQPEARRKEQEPVYTLVGQSKLLPGISPILFILIPSQGERISRSASWPLMIPLRAFQPVAFASPTSARRIYGEVCRCGQEDPRPRDDHHEI